MKKLDLELENMIEEERRYWEKNDAKLRAVEQRVGSYEEFRQMVLGAHLRPLDKKENISEIKQEGCKWNLLSCTRSKTGNSGETKRLLQQHQIKNVSHFMTCWKECSDEEKVQLVSQVGPVGIKKLFSTDLRFDFFDELVVTLDNHDYTEITFPVVIEILKVLSQCRGFRLVTSFMSPQTKHCCQSLFQKLSSSCINSETLRKLFELYSS
ncbi:coiled-coil domain-containing protein 103-like [Octopus sinensis]|uniref:Coiled-coil domain-containing protein 103-like n=1 Tax=Octopus sinensis TaxID=2607531 RepID=A0A6P7U6E3_9MOLL|nr:coiled-coil domain-containing protein 103-like [Octopus sinensis]